MSGLPRSGSTLLSALLNQREDLYCSSLSATTEVLDYLSDNLINSESFKSGTYVKQQESLYHTVLDSAYSFTEKEYIIDKNRMWTIPKYHNMLRQTLNYEPKFLIPVRPLKEIVSSFIRLFEKNPGNYLDRQLSDLDFIPWAQYNNISDARVDLLLNTFGHIRGSMSALYFAMSNENQKNFCYIKYEELIGYPEKTMYEIENFLDIPHFQYDFENIVAEKHNDEETWGIKNMHTVKNKIINEQHNENLSEYSIKRCEIEDFWTKHIL